MSWATTGPNPDHQRWTAPLLGARVTQADLHYEGSITIDSDLMDAADILPFEQVHVLDVDSGEIVACGTPEEVTRVSASYTGQYLRKLL